MSTLDPKFEKVINDVIAGTYKESKGLIDYIAMSVYVIFVIANIQALYNDVLEKSPLWYMGVDVFLTMLFVWLLVRSVKYNEKK